MADKIYPINPAKIGNQNGFRLPQSFFKDYLGYGKTYWIKLYEKNDLRKVFYVIADLLEEVKQLRENKDFYET